MDPAKEGLLTLLAVYGGLSPDHRGCPTAAVVAAAAAAAEAQQGQEGAQDACEEGLLAWDF